MLPDDRRSRQRHRGAQHRDLPSPHLGGLTSRQTSSETKVAGSRRLVLGVLLGVRLPVKHLGLLAAADGDPGDEVVLPVDPDLGDPLLLYHDVLRGLVVEFPAEITEGQDWVAGYRHQGLGWEILDVVRNRGQVRPGIGWRAGGHG